MRPSVLILILLLLSPLTSCLADRGFIPLIPVDIYEDAQNAIVAWNGTCEVLELSVNVRSSGRARVLEVLPLPSKPYLIAKGNFSSFEKIAEIVEWRSTPWWLGLAKGSAVPVVEVVFRGKIGVHDITVVKVLRPEEFKGWVTNYLAGVGLTLKELPKGLLRAIGDYLDRGFKFFVLDLIEVSEERSVEPIIYGFRASFLYYPFKITSATVARSSVKVNLFLITEGIPGVSKLYRMGFEIASVTYLYGDELAEILPQALNLFKGWRTLTLTYAKYEGPSDRLREDLIASEQDAVVVGKITHVMRMIILLEYLEHHYLRLLHKLGTELTTIKSALKNVTRTLRELEAILPP